jgi:hypothetical protein
MTPRQDEVRQRRANFSFATEARKTGDPNQSATSKQKDYNSTGGRGDSRRDLIPPTNSTGNRQRDRRSCHPRSQDTGHEVHENCTQGAKKL